MNIHGLGRPGQVPARESAEQPRRSDPSRTEAAERVDVSSQARTLADHLREPEAPDMERVERLRAALAEGSFVVDSERIARVMVREEA